MKNNTVLYLENNYSCMPVHAMHPLRNLGDYASSHSEWSIM
jgi:hypothetical protein